MECQIYSFAKIVNQENFTAGENSQIDDFVFLNAGKCTRLGRHVHIASFCSIIGGGEFVMEDFSGLSAGCRIITGSDDFLGRAMTNPTVPSQYTRVKSSFVHIGRHAIIGTNAIIFPGVEIGEGAAVAAGCIVRKSLAPWMVYGGPDCAPMGQRPSRTILRMEQELAREQAH
jgi:galactoside O-acetyltransferase